MKGESRSALSQEAKRAALTVRVACTSRRSRSRRGIQRITSSVAASFCLPQPPRDRDPDQRQPRWRAAPGRAATRTPSGRRGSGRPSGCAPASATSARWRRTRSRGRPRRRARSRARRRAAAAAARGRRPRGRGRSARGSRRAASQVRRGIARQAPERAVTSPAGRRRGKREAMAAGPDDPGEVDRVTGGVDPRAAAVGDQRLPGGPAALLEPGPADRLAEPGLGRRVGVEDDEQVAPRHGGAGVAAAGEPRVASHLQQARGRGQRADGPRRFRRRSRCRRRSAHRPRAAPPAAAGSVRASSSRLFQATITDGERRRHRRRRLVPSPVDRSVR